MSLEVTLQCAGVLVIIWYMLMENVIAVRVANKVSMGDGGIPTLATRLRAHANFTENAPLFLLLLAVVELGLEPKMPRLALHLIAAFFVFGRICHAIGFSGAQPSMLGRILGTGLTLVPSVVLATYALLGWNLYGHVAAIAFSIVGAFRRFVILPSYEAWPTSLPEVSISDAD
eukprot:TRINITY_DN45127_c0_g1_i1.p1 TRINITY_DN45127_c0_g1~~TRINITY_DN45127_c0_g1_i1.p1  ORF type:complete len:173 (-),score=20.12 TRINITY_DN45127_c0_g1_i1:184-702(-)